MVDMSIIGGTLSALNTALEIAKSLVGLRDTAVIREKVIELQSAIIAAQSSALSSQAEQSVLLSRIGELEKEIAQVKVWESEKQNYELRELKPGSFVYSAKDQVEGTRPAHHICANCYNNAFKSILQREMRFPGRSEVWACHSCGSIVYITGHWHHDHATKRPSR